jgi:hypothetical protein
MSFPFAYIKNEDRNQYEYPEGERMKGTFITNEKQCDVVYGSFNDFETIFLPSETARHYARLHDAHLYGITFVQLYDQLPKFFNSIIDYYCYTLYGMNPPSCEGNPANNSIFSS